MICSIGVQSYSNIDQTVNFHIDMTQPDKTKVVLDKLLVNGITKQLNIISTSSFASNNESAATMQEFEKSVHTDIDHHLVRNIVLSLLDLQ